MFRLATTAILFVALAAIQPAHANLVISRGVTANAICASGVCTASAAKAVLNISTLEAMLAAGNVKVATGSAANDIDVDAALTWASKYALTFDAHSSIQFDAPVSVTGMGGLSLVTNDGGSGGLLLYKGRGSVTFWSLSNSLTINGAAYTLVDSVQGLAAAVQAGASENFALAKSYDAKNDGTYAGSPVNNTLFGTLEGLGNTISNVTINDPAANTFLGLIASNVSASTIEGLYLANMSISANGSAEIGALVGANSGIVRGVSVTGTINIVNGNEQAGGIAGVNDGTVENSSAGVAIMDAGSGGPQTGGLVGRNQGTITKSFATGTLVADNQVGGLVGLNNGPISFSYATGNVTARNGTTAGYAGGLVGWNDNTITDSHATGTVSGNLAAGGFVGQTQGKIVNSFSTGSVSINVAGSAQFGDVGGFVGSEGSGSDAITGSIANCYSFGSATVVASNGSEGSSAGGFAGTSGPGSSIRESYSLGGTSAGPGGASGGFIGGFFGGVGHDYWDTTTSGTSQGVSGGNVKSIKGLTTSELQAGIPADFGAAVWKQSSGVNGGFPYLKSNPPG